MFPAARLSDLTATGDVIAGPGVPVVLIGSLPAAVIGDMVSGPGCVGSIAMGCSLTVHIGGRPAARVTAMAAGANPLSGVPVTTPIIPPACPLVLIGG
jgi:uncharacterized Zn-binding protein involved in type VI secretion